MKHVFPLALAGCLLLAAACGRRPAPQPVQPPAAGTIVAVAPIQPEPPPPSAPHAVAAPGVVAATFDVTGRIAEIAVRPGDWVEAGQYVGRLDLGETIGRRDRLQKAFQDSETEMQTARMAYMNLKQQAEAVAVDERQMEAAEERLEQTATKRDATLKALRQAQAESQRGILVAPCRGEVTAILAAAGADVGTNQAVLTIRQP